MTEGRTMNTTGSTEMTETHNTGQQEGEQSGGKAAAATIMLLVATAGLHHRTKPPQTPPATHAPDHCNPQEFFRWAEDTSRWNPSAAEEQIHLFTPAGEELFRMYAEGEISAEDMRTAAALRRGAEERLLPPQR